MLLDIARPSFGALLLVMMSALAGCDQSYRSSAADVPGNDVRRISDARKARTPDAILAAANTGRMLGADSVATVLFVISDYECPECQQWFDATLPVLRQLYVDAGKIRISFVHYPQRQHPQAVRAANAAMCASAEGVFWDASARIYATRRAWSASADTTVIVDSLVTLPGIDAYTLRLCVEGKRMLRQIRMDIDWADTLQLGHPPMLLIGNRRLSGTASLAMIKAAIDSSLAGK